jgi:hypothetical protein
MRLEESAAIGELLRKTLNKVHPRSCINLGSGNIEHLARKKPWIINNVFAVLESNNCTIYHADIQSWPGVDFTIDLLKIESLNFCEDLLQPRIFILANVLEHIPSQLRSEVLENILSLMASNDLLVITVPHAYPFHPDPIDTMYRPTAKELTNLLPLTWLDASTVDAGSFRDDLRGMNPWKKLRKIAKPLWPFRRFSKYISDLHRLTFLFRPYRISIAIGQKP